MTGHQVFADGLKARIECRYRDGAYKLGWRLLYSPAIVLESARLAFVGLNPGGRARPNGHAEFAMPSGSAYAVESWKGKPPGTAPLQRQVLSLFEMLGETPENVLAGNLVPFRSPGWSDLPGDRKAAVEFGQHLWRDIICRARPALVVTYGDKPFVALHEILRASEPEKCGLDWGRYSARRCVFPGGRLVGLPHLSRFPVVTTRRDKVLELFGPVNQRD